MRFLILDNAKRSLQSLNSDVETPLDPVSFGGVLPLAVGRLRQLLNPAPNGRRYDPLPLAGWTIRAAIGKIQLPIGGFFQLIQPSAGNATLLNQPVPPSVTAAQLAAQFKVAVTVTSPMAGYFIVAFQGYGAQTAFIGDAAGLAPALSLVECSKLVPGSSTVHEVWSIRLLQQPAAYAVLPTVNIDSEVSVDLLSPGSSGVNHKVRVKIDPLPYDGRFTLKVNGVESPFIPWDATEDAVRAALVSMAGIEEGDVSVFKEEEGAYLIGFQGNLASTNMGTIIGDGSALRTIPMASGEMDLRVAGIESLLGSNEQAEAFFEIEGTPAGGNPVKMYRERVVIEAAVMDPATISPTPRITFYSKAEVDALVGSLASLAYVDAQVSELATSTQAALETATNNLVTNFNELESSVDMLTSDVAAVQASLSGLGEYVNTLVGTVGSLQNGGNFTDSHYTFTSQEARVSALNDLGLQYYMGELTPTEDGEILIYGSAYLDLLGRVILSNSVSTLIIDSPTAGSRGTLIVQQDSLGGRVLHLPSGSKVAGDVGGGGQITLSADADAVDVLRWLYDGASFLWSCNRNFS